ncbi:MAG: hypothetical protein BWZ10_01668 [candidate division BRC1 bacterium ADurb.BinA364]|nr:MAG: hypothetical protein BWZ10_01668 [candidate division BRC1 bacterium ADurb.BinA364]
MNVRAAIVDDDVRIDFARHLDQFKYVAADDWILDNLGIAGERPGDIEPQDVDLAILGQQLANLIGFEAHEIGPALGMLLDKIRHIIDMGIVPDTVGMMPVDVREIEADFDSLGAEGLDQFRRDVGMGRLRIRALGIGDFEIGFAGVVIAKAVVVFGHEDHVAHAGVLGGPGPFGGIVLQRIESFIVIERGGAFAGRQFAHDVPDAAARALRPGAPVNEQAEFPFVPFLHPRLGRFQRRVIGGRGGADGGAQA